MSGASIWRTWRGLALVVPVVLLALAGAVLAQSDRAGGTDFMPTFTIREVMDSMVMSSADILWNAVAVNVTADGVEETAPETDEDWAKIRWAAVTLAEATNVLMIPGRAVAGPEPDEEVAEGDLSPAEIQALLDKSWPAWVAHAHVLHEAAVETVRVIDAKDVDGLTEVGGAIDAACESCHLQFWYPDQ